MDKDFDTSGLAIHKDAVEIIDTPLQRDAFLFWNHAWLTRHHEAAAFHAGSGNALSNLYKATEFPKIRGMIHKLSNEISERAVLRAKEAGGD
jgi:hypothetical protein